MSPSRFLPLMLLVSSATLLAACGEQESEDAFQEDDPALFAGPQGGADRPPPFGSNGLLPSCFWAHGSQQALRSLGGGALDHGGRSIASIPLSLVPASCRQVIDYAVQCALPAGQVLNDPVTGVDYEGWWGLAPSWSSAALSTDGRRNVTACLIQRLNATGTPVPILLEGPNPAIAHSEANASLYPIEESTAFGDLFSSTIPLFTGLPAFKTYVCWEDLLPQSCGLLGLPLLGERVCDDALLCGLTPLGPCSLSCVQDGPYWKCRTGPLSPWWTQTVRVRLDSDTCE